MSKKELVEVLLEKGVEESKSSLEKKTIPVLTEMLESLTNEEVTEEEVATETVDEEKTEPELTEEDVEEGLKATEDLLGKSEFEVVAEMTHQLGIFTEFIYHVRNEGAVVMIENVGVGDVYVDTRTVRVGDKDKRVLFGDKEVFEGAQTLHLIAASQPEVKITELK